ncbi:MAG: CPBP family intramembrane metalloprotease [Nitrospira sp.]|nr:MAG: CPBP family intramembrane metalloprotease [Nitrospira sp.]
MPDHLPSPIPNHAVASGRQTLGSHLEQSAWLGLLPVIAPGLYYAMPLEWQAIRLVQFLPQLLAYASFLIWLLRNHSPVERLGLARPLRSEGLRWGLRIGLALGAINVSIILLIVPWLGYDIQFLRETPHAQAPTWLMLPWLIMLIAVGVELNFRGFLLGRLLILAGSVPALPSSVAQALAIGLSALVFSFDPFMVVTFRHLHWIALWDGVVWGMLRVRLQNLYAPIVAHTVEVIVMYSVVRAVLH